MRSPPRHSPCAGWSAHRCTERADQRARRRTTTAGHDHRARTDGGPWRGTEVAAQLLVTAGDNPDRLPSEAALARLCGTAPLPASSGRTTRPWINRGGDRHANSALHIIALVRLASHHQTQHYAARRRTEGLSNLEIIRCPKPCIAREIHHVLVA